MPNKRFSWLIVAYVVIIFFAGYFVPKEIDWEPNFSKNYTVPYGCKILFSELDQLFSPSEVVVNINSLYQQRDSILDNTLHIIIDDKITMDSLDTAILLDAVFRGNQVLIAANQFPSTILDTVGLELQTEYLTNDIVKEGFNARMVKYGFYLSGINGKSFLDLEVDGTIRYFMTSDSSGQAQGLGWIEGPEKANFIYHQHGRGKLFLHTNPFLFTNYHILAENGAEYLSSILSFLPETQNIWWDEYYKAVNHSEKGKPLQVLLAEPPLRWALYLSLLGVLLILLFMSKRRQRIIPEAITFRNDSRELVETIGDLYFNTSDNRTILIKKIDLLKKELSRNYKCYSLSHVNDKVLEIYKQKTGKEIIELKGLFMEINAVSMTDMISDTTLLRLNNNINMLLQK